MERADTVTVPINGVRIGGRRGLAGCLFVLVILCLPFGAALASAVDWDMSWHGMTLGEALWAETTRPITVVATLLTVLTLAIVVTMVVNGPRAATRREARVSAAGLELVTHPHRWYRGTHGFVAWHNVQVISAHHEIFTVSTGKGRGHVPREVLELLLYEEVDGLPEFAAAARVDSTRFAGVQTPATRVRIGGVDAALVVSVRQLAAAVGQVRPDLFYLGTAVEQWFTPTPHAEPSPPDHPPTPVEPQGHASPEPSSPEHPPTPTEPPVRSSATPEPQAEIWLRHRSLRRAYGMPALLVALGIPSYLGMRYMADIDADGLLGPVVGIVGLVVAFPFIAAAIGVPLVLVTLPQATAPAGILLDADGLVIVEKRARTWRHDMTRVAIPWTDVQAVVARDAAVAIVQGQNRNRRVVDIYLRGDTTFQRAGTGFLHNVFRVTTADSAGIRDLVTFPAVVLRLVYSPTAERQGARAWAGFSPGSPERRTFPAHQLRPALYAFRPELCHGFHDLPEPTR